MKQNDPRNLIRHLKPKFVLLAGYESQKKTIASLQEQPAQVHKLINGFRSERFLHNIDVAQLPLFATGGDMAVVEEAPQETITYTGDRKKHQGRNALP